MEQRNAPEEAVQVAHAMPREEVGAGEVLLQLLLRQPRSVSGVGESNEQRVNLRTSCGTPISSHSCAGKANVNVTSDSSRAERALRVVRVHVGVGV